MTKICSICKTEKSFEHFYDHKNGKDGKFTYCIPCHNQKLRDHKKNNPQMWSVYNLRANLKMNYGMTVEDYERMLAKQNGKCAICKTEDPGGPRFYIDHDHSCCNGRKSCGKCIRGLLCNNCNNGLGRFKDSIESLASALAYLSQGIYTGKET